MNSASSSRGYRPRFHHGTLANIALTVTQVSVETFAKADVEEFLELSRSEYVPSVGTDADHVRWKHVESPFGASTYIRLVAAGKSVGRALLQPRPMYTASQKFDAACVTDVLIGQEFRSPPTNFINLTKASGEVSRFDLVYHTSNERTDPLYRKLFRIPQPFSLRGYGLPLRLAGFLSKIIRRRIGALDWLVAPFCWLFRAIAPVVISAARLDVSSRAMDDDALEMLCTKCLHSSGPLLARTKAFLKWRFADAPLWPATVHCVDQAGQFLGYVVTRKLELGGLNHFVLMDFVLDPDTPPFVQVALRLWLVRRAITSGVDALFTMANPLSRVARTCVGFPLVPIPDGLLPHVTPIFMRARSSGSRRLETDQSVHLTLADLDYF